MALNRRHVIAGTGAGLGFASLGFVLSGAVGSVFGVDAAAVGVPRTFAGYGELVPDPAGLVDLPAGFRYNAFSRVGTDPLASGGKVPGSHDGMCAFATYPHTTLVRNHELSPGADNPVPQRPGIVYDPGAAGGTTTAIVDGGRLLSEDASLAGTSRNCAGGPTPWVTWLTCEETEATPESEPGLTKKHGYVFEVDPLGRLTDDTEPVALAALGRYAHEAVAVDPTTGIVYLTEDAAKPFGLLYRFLPVQPMGGPGSLRAGGKLQALAVPGTPDLSAVTELNTRLPVTWADVPDPDAATDPVRTQFADSTVTRVPKAEGMFWARGTVFVVSSFAKAESGSAGVHEGQVWRLDPEAGMIELVLRMVPGGRFDGPDNITVSSYGPIVLCEDGDGENYLVTVGDDGVPYPLARNATGESEWAGATFSPDGTWLYANVQTEGYTVAITGPWWRG